MEILKVERPSRNSGHALLIFFFQPSGYWIPYSLNIKSFIQIIKILAIEKEIAGTTPEDFQPLLKAEAQKVWELQQQNIIREIHFRADRSSAVLILECDGVDEAKKILQTLPLVQANLIEFEIIPLKPYPGFERLFGNNINDCIK